MSTSKSEIQNTWKSKMTSMPLCRDYTLEIISKTSIVVFVESHKVLTVGSNGLLLTAVLD